MIKKLAIFVIILGMAVSLAACGSIGSITTPLAPTESEASPLPSTSDETDVPAIIQDVVDLLLDKPDTEGTSWEIITTSLSLGFDSFGKEIIRVYYEIRNTGTEPFLFKSSSGFILEDADGSVVAKGYNLFVTFPDIVEPGELCYFFGNQSILPDIELSELKLVPAPTVVNTTEENIRFEVSDFEITTNSGDEKYGRLKVTATIENTTSVDFSDVLLAAVLYDTDGNMLDVILEHSAISANTKVEMSKNSKRLPPEVTADSVGSYITVACPGW